VVTLYDVARLAGVSTATVSRVVHDQDRVRDSTRARVQQVIEELGYVPDGAAQSLSRRRKNVIGLVCVERQSPRQQYDIESMSLLFYDEILRRVERQSRTAGVDVIDSPLLEAGEVLQDTYEALRPIQETPLGEVREALRRLPLPYREPLVLAHIGGFSYKEISEILAIPLGTVMSRLFRARRLLRSELREPARRTRST